MNRESWTSLAERLERAGGADREIDREICLAARWRSTFNPTPSLSSSVDGVLALIRETLPGWSACIETSGWSQLISPDDAIVVEGQGRLASLGLAAAYCRARAASVIEIAGSGERDG